MNLQGTCQTKETTIHKSLIPAVNGDICEENDDCISNNCQSRVCKPEKNQQNCTLTLNCDIGEYCDTNVCVKVKEAGEMCNLENLNECGFGMVCA